MVILTAEVIAGLEMASGWKTIQGEEVRGFWWRVLLHLYTALTFYRLVCHHHRGMWLPWQQHVGSKHSVQLVFFLFLSANWLTPPSNVFRLVFFAVWCLFCVPTACTTVNRFLEAVFLSFPIFSSFFSLFSPPFLWFTLSCLHQVTVLGHRQMCWL